MLLCDWARAKTRPSPVATFPEPVVTQLRAGRGWSAPPTLRLTTRAPSPSRGVAAIAAGLAGSAASLGVLPAGERQGFEAPGTGVIRLEGAGQLSALDAQDSMKRFTISFIRLAAERAIAPPGPDAARRAARLRN